MSMNVVFSSPAYQVIEYPELDAYEVVDSQRGTGGFLRGDVADLFRESMEEVIAHSPTQEALEDVISRFDALMNQPLRYH